jgi:hypothetical protein
MSQLERLPVELLEKVYLFALNINLPMASPIIGGKLSSDLIYHKSVMAAFGPTWAHWPDLEPWVNIRPYTDLLFPRRTDIDELTSVFQVRNSDGQFFMC